MQLIFETEPVADIKDNMSSLEESLDEKLITDAIMDSLKHISYGNKENIQKQDNIHKNEDNIIHNNKPEAEHFNEDVAEEVDIKENIKETIDDEDVVTSGPEESLEAEMPDSNESHDDSNNADTVQLKMEQEEPGPNDGSDSSQNEETIVIEQIKQEVNDILALKVSNLNSNAQRKITSPLNNIVEELNDNIMTEFKNNDKPIETLKLNVDNDCLEEPIPSVVSSTTVSSTSDVIDVSPVDDDIIVNTETEEKEFSIENNINDEPVPEVPKEDKQTNDVNDIDSECSKAPEDKLAVNCIETVTIQDESDDIIDTAVVEPMDVEEVCEEKSYISNKRDNEITLLDSPVNAAIEKTEDESNSCKKEVDCNDVTESIDEETTKDATFVASNDKVMIIDRVKENSQKLVEQNQKVPPQQQIEKEPEKTTPTKTPILCRLSNNLNILSDDEDEPPQIDPPKEHTPEKQFINLEDDDDIMLIDEDTNSNKKGSNDSETVPIQNAEETDLETGEITNNLNGAPETQSCTVEEDITSTVEPVAETEENEKVHEESSKEINSEKPLIPQNFLKLSKKNITDMTRDELEEFCILKIVESIVDRSNLSEIKSKLKVMAQSLEEYKKKAMMLTKQNTDLEAVLQSLKDDQKDPNFQGITPLKITRGVGIQVYMTEKAVRKKPIVPASQQPSFVSPKVTRSSTNQLPKPNKTTSSPNIPVPRLIPANNSAIKGPTPQNVQNNSGKLVNSPINGVRNPVPTQKNPEKRPLNKAQSVTVDLTDDEPPTKMAFRSPAPPVRLVPAQNLLAPQRAQFGQTLNGPRKVYIPISGPQGQQIKPGQTLMLKTSPTGPPRHRAIAPTISRIVPNQIRMNKIGTVPRHPAPLPDAMKQYQPPNWKALPPAPDLKLSKVENGIVISWKIDGYQEDSYEEIASYQLYAYQETQSPPNTSLWKKIGDVKALPLPMACTLTQFMAGYKYYFAVRAVDVKSRLGPFSVPGSILLLSKM